MHTLARYMLKKYNLVKIVIVYGPCIIINFMKYTNIIYGQSYVCAIKCVRIIRLVLKTKKYREYTFYSLSIVLATEYLLIHTIDTRIYIHIIYNIHTYK